MSLLFVMGIIDTPSVNYLQEKMINNNAVANVEKYVDSQTTPTGPPIIDVGDVEIGWAGTWSNAVVKLEDKELTINITDNYVKIIFWLDLHVTVKDTWIAKGGIVRLLITDADGMPVSSDSEFEISKETEMEDVLVSAEHIEVSHNTTLYYTCEVWAKAWPFGAMDYSKSQIIIHVL